MATEDDNIVIAPSSEDIGLLKPMPTHLSAIGIKQSLPKAVVDQSLLSARTVSKTYLEILKKKLQAVASRELTPQQAQDHLKDALEKIGYEPTKGFPESEGGTAAIPPAKKDSITDLSSERRIRLIADTNVAQARSMAQVASSGDPFFSFFKSMLEVDSRRMAQDTA